MKKGDKVIITAIHVKDGYHNDRKELIGTSGIVIEKPWPWTDGKYKGYVNTTMKLDEKLKDIPEEVVFFAVKIKLVNP